VSASQHPNLPNGNGRVTTAPTQGDAAGLGDASVSDLLSRLSADATLLFRQEVELAKAELRRELTAAGKAAGMLAAGALLGLITLLLLAWAASWGLAEVLPPGLAFLIVGAVFGAVAVMLATMGRKRMQAIDLTPHATIETLQQDKEMLTDRRTR
jgi:hypothetical protein